MSFYLLPPVSYQTQQKLKKEVQRKKEQKQRHKSRNHSVGIESSGSSIKSPSSRSIRSNSIFNRTVHDKSDKSIDEISNLDSLSITSERSEATEAGSKRDKKKSHNHTFNYSYNTDLNEVVKFTKSHRASVDRADRRKGSYSGSSYSPSQYPYSTYSSSIYSDEDSLFTHQHNGFTSTNIVHPASNQNTNMNININTNTNNQIKPDYKLEFKDDDITKEDFKNSLEFQLSDDEEDNENALTRVYSDVDSIFSTKADNTPKARRKFFKH